MKAKVTYTIELETEVDTDNPAYEGCKTIEDCIKLDENNVLDLAVYAIEEGEGIKVTGHRVE